MLFILHEQEKYKLSQYILIPTAACAFPSRCTFGSCFRASNTASEATAYPTNTARQAIVPIIQPI